VPRIRFGVRIPFTGPASNSARLRQAAIEAERLGFDAVLAQDHFHKTFERHPQNPMASGSVSDPGNTREPVIHETVTSMAYLAAVTERVELVTAVTPLPLREPIVLAKQLATLDVHANGRLVLGVGVANKTDLDEFRAMGVPFEPYAARYAQASEYVAAMRRLWTEPAASFHGEHVDFEGLVFYPKPVRPIPVWIGAATLAGGLGRPAVRFALEHADGVIPHAVTSPATLAEMIDDFGRVAADAGRDISDFTWCAQRRFSIGATPAEAEENVAWMKREQADMWKYVGHLYGRGEGGTALSHAMATVGTPERIVENLQTYVDAGATYFGIAFTYPTFEVLIDQMRLFARDVIPVFRDPTPVAAAAGRRGRPDGAPLTESRT
jgi:probable F420-dependent oxidoreductase